MMMSPQIYSRAYLDLISGGHGLLLSWDDANVEQAGQDEDQARCRCGPCSKIQTQSGYEAVLGKGLWEWDCGGHGLWEPLTNDAEDVSDVGHEDD